MGKRADRAIYWSRGHTFDRVQFFSGDGRVERGGYRRVDRCEAVRRRRSQSSRQRYRAHRWRRAQRPCLRQGHQIRARACRDQSRRSADQRTFRQPGAEPCRCAVRGQALRRLRRGCPPSLSARAASGVGLRHGRHRAERGGASNRRTWRRRDRRSLCGDRTVRQNRKRQPDRRSCRDRRRGSSRPGLRDRRPLHRSPMPVSATASSSIPDVISARTASATSRAPTVMSRFRRSAASRSATTSKSDRARGSIAAASATPSSAKAPRSIISARSDTIASSASIASSSRSRA